MPPRSSFCTRLLTRLPPATKQRLDPLQHAGPIYFSYHHCKRTQTLGLESKVGPKTQELTKDAVSHEGCRFSNVRNGKHGHFNVNTTPIQVTKRNHPHPFTCDLIRKPTQEPSIDDLKCCNTELQYTSTPADADEADADSIWHKKGSKEGNIFALGGANKKQRSARGALSHSHSKIATSFNSTSTENKSSSNPLLLAFDLHHPGRLIFFLAIDSDCVQHRTLKTRQFCNPTHCRERCA